MSAMDRLQEALPILIGISLFFGFALWFTPNPRPTGSVFLKQHRFTKLTLMTMLSAAAFLGVMALVTLLLF